MGDRGKRWLIGCGSGCGVMVLLAVVLVMLAAQRFERAFSGLADAGESWDELAEVHGDPTRWTPAPDGATPADRIEVFLEARELMIAAQADADAALTAFPPEEFDDDRPWWSILYHAVDAATDLVPPLAEYAEARNRILLDAGMGYGEYGWIYTTAYHSWLGNDPGDAPMFRGDVARGGRHPGEPLFTGEDATFGIGPTRARWRVAVMDACRNRLHALRGADGDHAGIERRLVDEIRRLDGDPRHVLWDGEPPESVVAAFAPYRDRFEATYRPDFNAIEAPFDYEADWN